MKIEAALACTVGGNFDSLRKAFNGEAADVSKFNSL